jgi:hypothetical protein
MNRSGWILTLVAVLSVSAACSNDPVAVVPHTGTLTLRLTTPHVDDGALTFTLSGPPINNVTAANASLRLFTRGGGSGDSTIIGVLVGDLATGAVVTLYVPDVTAVAHYSAHVLEVADRDDALRASLAGYVLSVAP